jgi:hypothetical protein
LLVCHGHEADAEKSEIATTFNPSGFGMEEFLKAEMLNKDIALSED